MDNHIFRSALSGFNRQDVMEYIERTQKEAAENAQRLEAEAEELRRTGESLRQDFESCIREKEELSRQLTDMSLRYDHAKSSWDAQTAASAALKEDVAQRDETVRELTVENQKLHRRVQELEDQSVAIRKEKERITQLELEACQRGEKLVSEAQAQAQSTTAQAQAQAESIVREAREQADAIAAQAQDRAEKLRRESEERIAELLSQYNEAYASFETMAGHVTGELRKMDVTMTQLPLNFHHLQESLQNTLDKARQN